MARFRVNTKTTNFPNLQTLSNEREKFFQKFYCPKGMIWKVEIDCNLIATYFGETEGFEITIGIKE